MSAGGNVLTVVVALISGRTEDLLRCLNALHGQEGAPAFEVIVPYDPPCRDVTTLSDRFPAVRFIEAEGLETDVARAGFSREHHDALRSWGLRHATGSIVALTEDHAVVSRTWCADMVRRIEELPQVGAVGGAVECGVDRWLNRAVYYCDFGRYQNPLPDGPADFVSDSNVAYRREALDAISEVWQDKYRETLVHWKLVERGYPLWLTPGSLVLQVREGLRLANAFRERYVWGRSFAGTRVKETGATKRILFAALSWFLPFVLCWRLLRGVLQRRRGVGQFVTVLPLVFLLQCLWAFGEFVGYISGRPSK